LIIAWLDRLVLAQGPDAGRNLRLGVVGGASEELARRGLHDRGRARLVARRGLALDLVDGGEINQRVAGEQAAFLALFDGDDEHVRLSFSGTG
jgi:hypothetical protein